MYMSVPLKYTLKLLINHTYAFICCCNLVLHPWALKVLIKSRAELEMKNSPFN